MLLQHRLGVLFVIPLLAFLCSAQLIAQTDAPAEETLIREANAAYDQQDYAQGLAKYSEAIRRGSTDSSIAYNAACCAALAGKSDTAFDFLNKAIANGWIDAKHMKHDSDLKSLHADPRWSTTLTKLDSIVAFNKRRWSNRAFKTKFKDDLGAAEKAAGLSKLWAEVKFNFVNFHLVPELDWDAEYMEFMPKVLATKSTIDYYRLLEELVAKLKDAHTNVYLPSRLAANFNARPGLRTRMIERKVIVVKILDSKLADAGIKVGQEVTRINGQLVKDYADQKIKPYMSASTPQDLMARTYGHSLFRGPVNETIKLELLTLDGERLTADVARAPSNRVMNFLGGKAPFSFKLLDNNIGYVQLNSFGTSRSAVSFENAFDEIEKTDSLILDLRQNGGGSSNVGYRILGCFTDKPFLTSRWHTLQYRPTYRAWNRNPLSQHGSISPVFSSVAEQHYKKPVVMLVGPGTFSAAEDMAAAFDMLERGKIIGQPTGGSTGQPLSFNLPGGGSARVCTKHDSYANGTAFVGVGIVPDILVEPLVKDVVDGFDRELDVARKELENQQ